MGLGCLPATLARSAAILPVPTAAGSALRFRACFVDVQSTAVEVCSVESVDSGIAFRIDAHFHEGKASGLPGVAVRHEIDAVDRAVGFKHRAKIRFRRVEAEITDKYI
jgi:hypothetical protein